VLAGHVDGITFIDPKVCVRLQCTRTVWTAFTLMFCEIYTMARQLKRYEEQSVPVTLTQGATTWPVQLQYYDFVEVMRFV
jgi:hypothetical protein